MSKELKRRGFRFVGPTVCYAFMQAAGLVNDHVVSCFRYRELAAADRSVRSPRSRYVVISPLPLTVTAARRSKAKPRPDGAPAR